MTAELSSEELLRYSRQIGSGVLSREGQRQLKSSSALVTRAGGMGGPAALSLVMAGIGRVIIAHGGEMTVPDLNRQILGCEQLIGQPRAANFARYLRSMNKHVVVEAIDHEPDEAESAELARQVNIILSCPPTFEERMRLNRAALAAGVPLVDAAQWGAMGTLVVVQPGRTACLRCIYPSDPPFEEMFPVIGAISTTIGSLAALEAIKILSGMGRPLSGRMLMLDGHQGQVSLVDLRRDPRCPGCGDINREP